MCELKKQFQKTYLVLVNLTNSIAENCSETQKKATVSHFLATKFLYLIAWSVVCGSCELSFGGWF